MKVEPAQPNDPDPLPIRLWPPILETEVAMALAGTSNKSAASSSGTGYTLLKWANKKRPDLLPCIYNLAINLGIHPWKLAMVVVINKPHKEDYSAPKAY